ncbi:class II fumarate hydratase [Alteromonas sp. ASW11-19]|uniref:Fumarate hydratase class II n=1 Tax=Alteromonas salexigens TaxID=2982530 RepID=A0ABT2VRA3_9ALTE|nr:class II fumarate hydratase [Alteromonas salexigens]MCU7555845.1 class II fumarate hydratase [Alteromonas salexigens]
MSDTLYQKQTALALDNFQISGQPMPATFIHALGYVKAACASVNHELGKLDKQRADAIWDAAHEVAQGKHDDAFPLDVFQTGSGTSTNMNANEVIATLASRACGEEVHPNDHVNMGQSSNDVIPTTIHVSAVIASNHQLVPAVEKLCDAIKSKMTEAEGMIKTGRTHLMDAMPVTFSQEMSGWRAQLLASIDRIDHTQERLSQLAIGGTAVGTGINTHPEFGARVASALTQQLGHTFFVTNNHFSALSAQDTAVEFSGQLNVLATALMKISNDLRWMNSGPLAGLGEISLTKLQAGSSIMPGKVNPVIPEATAMVSAQVMGLNTAVTVAGQSGNFQLNVMLPLIGYNLLTAIHLLANACTHLADKAIADMQFNDEKAQEILAKNPILVTALNARIGYEKGAEIAKQAYQEKRPILDVAKENTDLSEEELRELLDPGKLV